MNRIILILGFIFVALGVASAQTAQEVKDQINAIKRDSEALLSKANSIKNNDLPKLPEQILEIAETSEVIIQTKNLLKKYEGKGDAVKDCQALFNANYYSIIDQLFVQINENITTFLNVSVEGLLKAINANLDKLSKQVDDWDKLSAEDKNKINMEINQISIFVDGSERNLSMLVENIKGLNTKLFPNQVLENVFRLVNECLKKIKCQ